MRSFSRPTREQRKLAEALRETGIALAASLDEEQVIDNLLDQISSILPFDAGSIIVMEGSQVRLTAPARIAMAEPVEQ